MKKFKHHLSFSILLQILGILVNGILGMGLEMIGLSILGLKNKKTLISLLKKFAFVVISQILIDLIFGHDAMIVEMIFLYLEKVGAVIIAMTKISIGLLILIFFQKYTLSKKSKSGFFFHFFFKSLSEKEDNVYSFDNGIFEKRKERNLI
ncbi:MAG: hypothetical protein AB8F94_12675 [Saprospiraceae bacterium]